MSIPTPRPVWQYPCPQCGAPSSDPIETHENGCVAIIYKCAEGHIWLVKWVAAS